MKYIKYIEKNFQSFKGKNIVITGANSGIGFSCALQCAYLGANVYLACRNKQRANDAIERIKNEVKEANLFFLEYDQADFASIENFANKIAGINIDVLILNAGIFKPSINSKTVNGFPLTTGTNYIGVYHLLERLSSSLKLGKIKQIIFVSSFVRWFANKNYLNYLKDDKNRLARAYFASKKMDFELALFTKERYPELIVNVMHPGLSYTGMVHKELNSMAKCFHKFGDIFLNVFSNSPEKSSLAFLCGIKYGNKNEIIYSYPRGLFHLTGLPGHKIIKNKSSNHLVIATNELFN